MQTLILYATKSGAAFECAELLANQFDDCTVQDISKPLVHQTAYDTVIIGSGVRMGRIYKPAKNFIKNNINLLLSKKTALYFCHAYPDTLPNVIEKNIPVALIKHATCVESFGGKPPFTSPKTQDWIRAENIKTFVTVITND